jgi:hypothetical protein
MVDSLFVPQYHDNELGVIVGVMTVRRELDPLTGAPVIVWDKKIETENTVVAEVHANYHKGGQRVRLDVRCVKGGRPAAIPDWLGERYRYAMAHAIRKNRHALEREFYIRRDEKIKGKIKRYNRLA